MARAVRYAPFAAMRAILLLLSALSAVCALSAACMLDIDIGVVEGPGRAQQLAAMIEAALHMSREAPVAAVEPSEALAPPGAVCALAGHVAEGSEGGTVVAALAGGDDRALRLANAAAARVGMPLLLVDDAPADATWEALQLYPHHHMLANACAALLKAKDWQRAVLLHEGGTSAITLLASEEITTVLTARQLPPPEELALLRNLLLVLKKAGSTNFIVWCSAECTVRVFQAAQRVGLLSERHSYVVLTLDLHTQPLRDYSHGGANVTALRLFDPEALDVANLLGEWARRYARLAPDEAKQLQAAPPCALLLAHVGAVLVNKTWCTLRLPSMPAARCEDGAGAFHADTLLNYLRSEEWEVPGLGGISWEADGGRRALQLEVVELARGGSLRHVGVWSPASGVTWRRSDAPLPGPPPDSMTNRTFTILIAENKPYVMKQESELRLTGNQRFEGFCIELIERLAQHLSFNYTFVLVTGSYGKYNNVTRKWEGMLGRLIEDPNVDFAITDLTITAEREHVVDFTTPFMNLGISILFKAPQQPEPKLFAFLHPFSNGVWLCLGFAYLGTSLLLYVVGRLCHEEWQNPYPCIEEPEALENQFTLANALWFNLGAVLLQGSEIAPVAYGSRAVAGAWWLFALVITSSYTANLATLLAKKSNNELIHNVNELAYNTLGISYGAKADGSTFTFFQHSESKMYQDMYKYMLQHKMPESNEEGIKKVMTENYAFLMESTTIEYETERNCEVVKVGSLLDSKGYGIAMKKNSTYRQALNLGLLALQEAGTLREMQRSWWEEKHGGGACKPVDDRESEKLEMKNFMGLFLVLVVGSALGVVVSCCDLAYSSWRRARAAGEPFHRRFWNELRFVFRFARSERPLHGPLSVSTRSSKHTEKYERASEDVEEEVEMRTDTRTPTNTRSRSRRRSSMHAASIRLARHTTPSSARS